MITHWLVAVSLALSAGLQAGDGQRRAYGTHEFLGYSQTQDVNESSGVTPSHFDADVFWTHNDSGHPPRVYAFRLSAADRRKGVAADLGYLMLPKAPCVDWEEITSGPGDTIYVFDGGDNSPCRRADKSIIRFKEPKIDWSKAPIRQSVRFEIARFEYSDPARPGKPVTRNEDRYDAECLLVDPLTGDVYVVTKRDYKDKPVARVYRLPAGRIRWDRRTVNVLQFVTDLSKNAPGVGAGGLTGMVTGGAVDPDGRHVIVRTYLAAYEFTLAPGRPFESIFEEKPQIISLFGEPQGEGICYARNGDLITTSEAIVRGPRFPIFITPRATATRPAGSPTP
jgi:hypothetical protein